MEGMNSADQELIDECLRLPYPTLATEVDGDGDGDGDDDVDDDDAAELGQRTRNVLCVIF